MEKAKAYSLSNDDINQILDPDTNIIVYKDLNKYQHIDEIFDRLNRCVMLYPIANEANGHWVCLWKKGNTINYFDPYGTAPEEPKEWVGQTKSRLMGMGQNRLTQLLKESGYKVFYNTYPYQQLDEDVATCGRWCVTRLVCKDMSATTFHKAVMKFKKGSPDNFAVSFTKKILGK